MSFVQPQDTWVLWSFMIAWAAVSIYLEQKYKWASVVSGCVIALIGAMVFANLNIIPLDSPVYDAIWDYVVPMAVPLLLFKADIRKIWRESGKSFGAFHISATGTILGTFLATFLVGALIPEIQGIAAMFVSTYIGGSVNFAAMKDAFHVTSQTASAGVVADNLLMALYFFVLMAIPNIMFFKKKFPHPIEDRIAAEGSDGNKAAAFWGRKEISLLDIASALAVTIVIVTVSIKLAALINASGMPAGLKSFLGQKYLLITTFTLILASSFPKFFENISGAQEIGTFFIYLFFVVIGVPASIMMILQNSPVLLLYAAIIVAINMVITLGIGKMFKLNLEELLMVSNANIGGPTTAAAMCIAKGWGELVVPALLVGVWGYIIGNYIGVFVGNNILGILGM